MFGQILKFYLNPADRNPAKITKSDKDLAKRLGFKDIKFPVKIRDTDNIEKRIPSDQYFWL